MYKKGLFPVLLLIIILLSGSHAYAETKKTIKIEIKPAIVCTLIACPKENQCCNSCSVIHWETPEHKNVVPVNVKFPEVQVDGCGKITSGPEKIIAEGNFNTECNKFLVTKFTVPSK